jgi:hypothetical protein
MISEKTEAESLRRSEAVAAIRPEAGIRKDANIVNVRIEEKISRFYYVCIYERMGE